MTDGSRRRPPRALLVGAALLSMALPAAVSGQQVNWGALSPRFQGATFLRNYEVCAVCHEGVVHKFGLSGHATYFEAGTTAVQGGCEACHGPRSQHVQDGEPIIAWPDLSADQQSNICMQCHAGGARMSFKAGTHLGADVSCTSCHEPKSPQGTPLPAVESCYGCHNQVRGQMGKASHHPVREGRMDCASCHNVHGANPSLLKTSTVSETCYSCHTEKRGPFVWEHAPVRENCANCHSPHGSSNRKLLNRKESFVCLSCHSYGGHINLPRYNRTSNPYGEGCVNCHMAIHGSNHPSGAKFTR